MTPKERYENSLIVLGILKQSYEDYKSTVREYHDKYRKYCQHVSLEARFWEDYHKNEYGTSLYCKDCGQYLGES